MREELRQAAAAFVPAVVAVDLASQATPEAFFWAIEQARGGAVPPGLQPVVEGAPGVVPDQPDVDAHPLEPASEALVATPGRGA